MTTKTKQKLMTPVNVIEAQVGEGFYNLVKRAKEHLNNKGIPSGYVVHNDVTVSLDADSKNDDICTIYDLKKQIIRLQNR